MIRNLLVLVLACAPAVTASASSHVPGHPQYKPPDPAWTPQRIVFDCAGRDTLFIAPGFGTTIIDSTVGAAADLSGYPCSQWYADGPEHVYRLEIQERTVLYADLEQPAGDLDLYLLNDCDTDSCLAGENEELLYDLAPGTYFLVVDTWGDGEVPGLPYELTIDARWPGIPPGPCNGDATVVDCGDDTIQGDLLEQPNLVISYDCSPDVTHGGEDWYEITSPALRVMKLEVQASSTALDPVLWIFDGCGPDAACLGYVNDTLAYTGEFGDGSGLEVLEWRQESELPATVWVAVDCVLPPSAEGGGDYAITIDCQTVPERTTSFGSLRALYR